MFPFCFSFYNQLLLCVSKLLFVIMCVLFRVTDKLLPFDLSFLILYTFCLNFMCLYSFFCKVLINFIYFSNVTSTYHMYVATVLSVNEYTPFEK